MLPCLAKCDVAGGQGRIAVVEYDSNADGRADYIAHYDERRQIRLIEVDEDHDSWVDRFEHYDAAGVLEKVGRCRKQRGRADEWTYRAPDGRPARIEYDDDGDGVPERAEALRDGIVVRIEADSDRDRWFTAEEAKEYGIIDNVIIGKGELA